MLPRFLIYEATNFSFGVKFGLTIISNGINMPLDTIGCIFQFLLYVSLMIKLSGAPLSIDLYNYTRFIRER